MVFICENNHYAISVPQSKQMAIEDVADRAAGYGFPGVVVDGNDVLACYGAMKTAHERARAGEGPTLDRVQDLPVPGPHLRRRRQDLPAARRGGGGPPPRSHPGLHRVPAGQRILDDATVETIRAEVKAQIDEAIATAWDAPDPTAASALRHVFASERR